MIGRGWFLSGLFLTTLSALMLEVLDTRLLSVLTWYHLSFFAVSTAMFGLSAGAVHVYFGGVRFQGEGAQQQLAAFSLFYALSIPTTHLLILRVPFGLDLVSFHLMNVAGNALRAAFLLALPFYLAGIAIGIALTRVPGRIGVTYSVDLVGAAAGCLLAVPILRWSDISTATWAAGSLALAGAFCFQPARERGFQRVLVALLLAFFLVATVCNRYPNFPWAARVSYTKEGRIQRETVFREAWNSHSQILVHYPLEGAPFFWGPGRGIEELRAETARLVIDGSADTHATRWDGDPNSLAWVRYDVTSAPYHLRQGGDAAVIGVGGGRDVLTALWARSRSVTGIELNGILIDLLQGELRDFTNIAGRKDVKLVHDEARSYLTRTAQHYDVLQMSLVDSWASTSAGGFTLSENGLYTREAWGVFLDRLKPRGIFSASRWFSPSQLSETSRLFALGVASLLDRGVSRPADHLVLLARHSVATLLVSPSPFAADDLSRLNQLTKQFDFQLVAAPGTPPNDPLLASILASRSPAELTEATRDEVFDYSVPTDARPYFFNLIKPSALVRGRLSESAGVVEGNLLATTTLLLLIAVSATLVLAVILVPLGLARQRHERGGAFVAGMAYFALIGTAFMMVQIPYMQRFSVYLGHPTYAVVVILFSMILFTGIGSMLSDRLPLRRSSVVVVTLPVGIAALLILVLVSVQPAIESTISCELTTRCLVVLAFTAPVSLLLGCCFPIGMRLLGRVTDTLAPWMWGINGACSVLASALAVGVSMWVGIDASLVVAAVLYLALMVPTVSLYRRGSTAATVRARPAEAVGDLVSGRL
jgi:hypothetical protein